MTFLMLPNDLVLSCLARVSRLYYPTLSLVSKRFRSLLASMELYKTRSLLNRTESCLYVCLRLSTGPSRPNWFALCRRPKTSNKYGLVPISSPNSPFECMLGAAAVGSNIYSIGGSINNNELSSDVMVMDCRSHAWRDAPSMHVSRLSPSVCVLDEKIYVTGGIKNLDLTNWMEIFDTKTQTWEFLNIPSIEICKGSEYKTIKYEGTILVRSEAKNATYKLHKGEWRVADIVLDFRLRGSPSYCVIENVLYLYRGLVIEWYNSNERLWRVVKGLSSWSFSRKFVQLVDYGGNMAAFWEENLILNNHKKKLIRCAEIALERDREGNIRGTLKWSDTVFITDEKNGIVHALATTL